MNLQARKLAFIQEFIHVQNEEIVSGLEKMLKMRTAELHDSVQHPISIPQLNADIDKSLEDSAHDRVVSAKDLKEAIKK